VTPEVIAEAVRLARCKANNHEIAAAFNISIDTFDAETKRNPHFASEIASARVQAVLDAKEVIWAELKGKDRLKAAAIVIRFWGDGKERIQVSGDPENPVQVADALARRTLSPDEARAILNALEEAREAKRPAKK
jgi:hypothetical protein